MPSNVARFEVLMYAVIGLGVFVSVLQYVGLLPSEEPNHFGLWFDLSIRLSVVAVLALFIWLVARRRRNWARWALLIFLIVGLPLTLPDTLRVFQTSVFVGIISVLQLILEVAATYFVFTGNAREWFRPVA